MKVTKRQLHLLIKEASSAGHQTVLTEAELHEIQSILPFLVEHPALMALARGAQAGARAAKVAAKAAKKAAQKAAKAAKKKMVQKAKELAKNSAKNAAQTSQS